MPAETVDVENDIGVFLNERCKDELALIGAMYPEKQSVEVNFQKLSEFSPHLSERLLSNPDEVIKEFHKAIEREKAHIAFASKVGDEPRLYVRFFNLPPENEIMVRGCTSKYLNRFFTMQGLVTMATDVLPKVWKGVFRCKRCQAVTELVQDKKELKSPLVCEHCGRKEFEMDEELSRYIDFQRLQVQEPLEILQGGDQAKRIAVWLEEDLIKKRVVPGQRIIITGTLRLAPPKPGKQKTIVYQKFVEANNVEFVEQAFEELEITEEEEEEIKKLSNDPKIYEKMISSVAPSIYGHNEAKEAVTLQLCGGASGKKLLDHTKIRDSIHILMIGDPGCLIGDERVALGDGTIVRLENMGDEHLQEINQQVLTGQGYNRELATTFHSYESQPIMEIITESGKCIKGTYNHPLRIIDGRERYWKRLDEIKVGDKLGVVPWIPCNITAPVKTGWKIFPRKYGPRPKLRLPEVVDEDVAAFLGFVLGDGWVTKTRVAMDVIPSEKDLLPKLKRIIKEKFNLDPKVSIREKEDRNVPMTIVEAHSVDLAKNLEFLREKRVPDLIMRSGNKFVSEFLAWLFEADGCVFGKGRSSRAIQLKSSEIELLRDVQMLLLRFSIHSRIVGRNLTIRRAKSMRKFAKSVGFRSKKKKTNLDNLIASIENLHHERGEKQICERVVHVAPAGLADVYDIEVPKGNRFIANGVVSHNTAKSQILKFVDKLAPKSIYVSGKSASGGGLTAIAEKDEFGEGGWVLKAGALVLASGGMACIDEFDKMSDEDRSAIHEALEQQTVSVAKAGIIATFRAESAVLAAANPKYSRYDPYKPPAEQFNIPASLISRFDLIFPIKDVLDETKDKGIADHILGAHKFAQAMAAESSDLDEETAKKLEPVIPLDLLKKYFAYARRNCHPIITDEAIARIGDYYVDLRKRSSGGSVPLTPRQLEALVRLAEASAKIRLSKTVEVRDADRAIRLVEFVLREIGMEGDDGNFDIDRIVSEHPKSERDKIYTITGIVKGLEEEYDMVPVNRVLEEAQEYHNIDNHTAEKLIRELLNKGDLYEPRHNHLKTVRQ